MRVAMSSAPRTPTLFVVARVVLFLGVLATLVGPWGSDESGTPVPGLWLLFLAAYFTMGIVPLIALSFLIPWIVAILRPQSRVALGIHRLWLAFLSGVILWNHRETLAQPTLAYWGSQAFAAIVLVTTLLEYGLWCRNLTRV